MGAGWGVEGGDAGLRSQHRGSSPSLRVAQLQRRRLAHRSPALEACFCLGATSSVTSPSSLGGHRSLRLRPKAKSRRASLGGWAQRQSQRFPAVSPRLEGRRSGHFGYGYLRPELVWSRNAGSLP